MARQRLQRMMQFMACGASATEKPTVRFKDPPSEGSSSSGCLPRPDSLTELGQEASEQLRAGSGAESSSCARVGPIRQKREAREALGKDAWEEAVALNRHGNRHASLKELKLAEVAFTSSIAAWKKLLRDTPWWSRGNRRTINNNIVLSSIGLSRVLRRQGHRARALASIRSALRVRPVSALRRAHAELDFGDCLRKSGDHHGAIRAYRSSVGRLGQLGSGDAGVRASIVTAQINMGVSQEMLQSFSEAADAYQVALGMSHPGDVWRDHALQCYVDALLRCARFDEVVLVGMKAFATSSEHFQQTSSAARGRIKLRVAMACAYHRRGQEVEAEQSLEAAQLVGALGREERQWCKHFLGPLFTELLMPRCRT